MSNQTGLIDGESERNAKTSNVEASQAVEKVEAGQAGANDRDVYDARPADVAESVANQGVLDGAPADLFENFNVSEAELAGDAAPFAKRPLPIRGGRRKGVPNRRTVELRALYFKMGLPHPVLAMGAVLRLGIDGIAEALKCELLDAAEYYRKVAADVAPYIDGKQPSRVAIEGGERLPVLVVGELAAAAVDLARARQEGALAIDDEIESSVIAFEQNQRLSASDSDPSQDKPSHGGAKALKER